VPSEPEYTSDVLVPSGMNARRPVLFLYPKKPVLAVVPLCQRNSMPRSLLSLETGAVSPPTVKIGSSTVVTVLLMVVVVPLTVRLPVITKSLLTVVVPPAVEPMFTLVIELAAPPVPMLTVLVVAEAVAPVAIFVVLAAVPL